MPYTTDHKAVSERGSSADTSTLPVLTLSEAARFRYFSHRFDQIGDLDGDIVECGVGWGRSLLMLAYLIRLENRGRHLWGFDSFEGFPEPTSEDASVRNPQAGEWKTDIRAVYNMLSTSGIDELFLRYQITLVKGFFAASLPKYTGDKIALLHADADLYDSYRAIAEHLLDRVVPGGVILFDEYMNTFENMKWPGAKKAIDEFFLPKVELRRDPASGKYYGVKREA